mmetsp:Transcript_71323/g.185980  ORF Transcript_71323/g.185980 Transcript_71323/m.185980 type:complete len:363 (+) Transcript_71323:78-1166(+)
MALPRAALSAPSALLLAASASALRASAEGDGVSPLLQHQFGGLYLLELSSDAGLLRAGAHVHAAAAAAGAARSRDDFAAATRALAMLGALLAVVAALMLGALLMLMRPHRPEFSKPPPQARSRAASDRPQALDTASSLEQEFEHHASRRASSACLSSGYECQSDATITDREEGQPSQTLVPLCPQLMVPASSNLRVVVPELACRRRQDTLINICSVPSLGGSPLFRARVSEGERAAPGARGIYLETLEGDQQFAWVSTEELWSSPGGTAPKLLIMRPDGLQFATMKKNNRGDYVVMCGLDVLAVFSAVSQAREARAVSGQGRLLAQIQRGVQGFCEVTTSPDIDAGLIILGLLAIDKCERAA